MDNKFSLDVYRRMLQKGKELNYSFLLFNELLDGEHSKNCLLRHDIDADVSAALKMAEVEAAIGVRSTYFFMTRSPIYNLTGRLNHQMIQEIISLGHGVGLHYDQAFKPGPHFSETEWINLEAEWMEALFNISIPVVSFHQPGPEVLKGEVDTGLRINTYDRKALGSFEYYSDSNRQFPLASLHGDGAIADCFENVNPKSFQLLIHPIWWVFEDETTDDVWDKVIVNNFEMSQKQMLATERAYGARRTLSVKKAL